MATQLLSFAICGLVVGFLFDIFRITRKAFKMPNILIYIEDILFWILTGLVLLYTIITFTDGQIRLYMIFTLILGTLIYFLIFSKYIIIINIKIIDIIKHIIKLLLLPFSKIKSVLIKKINIYKIRLNKEHKKIKVKQDSKLPVKK